MESHPPRRHYNVTLAVLVGAGMSYALMQSLVVPALTDIKDSLHTSETGVSWMLTAYLLSASVATPIIGRLGDMYGKERLLMIILVVLAAGTLVSALSSTIGPMLAGRVIQGAGGGIFPLAFGIIRDEFPRERVSQGIGLMSSLLGVGGALGVVLAGPIVENLNYHWLFWFPLAAIVVATVATHVFVPESPIKSPGHINWTAAALMSAGSVIVLVSITKTTTWGWGSSKTLAGIAVGLLVLALWVREEVRSPEPLVDMRMMRIHGVWTTNLVAFLVGVGMYSSFILIPQFVQEPKSTGYGLGASVVAAGLFLAPSTVTMVGIGQFTGRIERRFGSKLQLLAGAGFAAACFLLLVVDRSAPWEVYLAAALLGTGIGLAFAALANLIVENVDQHQTGVATGMNTVMRTLGGALGGQIAATFLAHNLIADEPTSHAYGLAFGMCAGALVVAIAVGLLVPRRPALQTRLAPVALLLLAIALAAPAAASAAEPPPRMFVYGDSITYFMSPYLRPALPGWRVRVDAFPDRHARQAARVLRKRGRRLEPVVDIGLGTVDDPDRPAAYRRAVRSVMHVVGPRRCVVWPNIYRPSGDTGLDWRKLNAVLDDEAARRRNLIVVDWRAMVLRHLDWRSKVDGTHVDERGSRALARAVARAARACRRRLARRATIQE